MNPFGNVTGYLEVTSKFSTLWPLLELVIFFTVPEILAILGWNRTRAYMPGLAGPTEPAKSPVPEAEDSAAVTPNFAVIFHYIFCFAIFVAQKQQRCHVNGCLSCHSKPFHSIIRLTSFLRCVFARCDEGLPFCVFCLL